MRRPRTKHRAARRNVPSCLSESDGQKDSESSTNFCLSSPNLHFTTCDRNRSRKRRSIGRNSTPFPPEGSLKICFLGGLFFHSSLLVRTTTMDMLPKSLAALLLKVVLSAIMQTLIYFALSNSSSVFSKDKDLKRLGGSFRMPQSASVRRVVVLLSGYPFEAWEHLGYPMGYSKEVHHVKT